MNCENIDRNIAPFYMSVMLEIERRRLSLGISMQEVCDRSGVADYYYSKALHASTPSGREARWSTLQDIVDALFPEGYDVVIKPKVGMRLNAEQLRCKIKFAAAASNPKLQRELMSELGKKGLKAHIEKYANMSEAERKRIYKKARKTRRQNKLLRAQIQKPQPKTKPRRGAPRPCVADVAVEAPCCTLDGIGAPAVDKGFNECR
jgi:transcriptional regulator with XRE-family HTH domain